MNFFTKVKDKNDLNQCVDAIEPEDVRRIRLDEVAGLDRNKLTAYRRSSGDAHDAQAKEAKASVH